MAGVAFSPSASADRQLLAFGRGHAAIPLRRGCMMYADNIGHLRQLSLAQCKYECTQLPGCGAVAFLRVAAYYSPLGRVEWVPEDSVIGLCQFRHANCTAKATTGACVGDYRQTSKKGWCVYALPQPSGTCRAPRISALPMLHAAAPTAAAAIAPSPTALAHTTLRRLVYYRVLGDVVLGGGINNMLMHIAQLLTGRCGAHMVLVLPLLAADPLANASRGDRGAHATMRFSRLFDWRTFVDRMSPCQLTENLPQGGLGNLSPQVNRVPLIALRDGLAWGGAQSSFVPTLARIYRALAPSAEVERLVSALAINAVRLAGPHWAAVHLPIERDWWWESDFCTPRGTELHGRRCFSPLEVSRAIKRTLRIGPPRASGTVLLYAPDKVHVDGPPVCTEGRDAVKLLLPAGLPYTVRNAAEQFFAVASPAGFYGNSYSTFSKGVAVMRHWAAARGGLPAGANRSFAYDCAKSTSRRWPRVRGEPSLHITLAHPGFELLATLPDHSRICRPPGRARSRGIG